MTLEQCFLFSLIVMLATTIEGMVGFGGNILALPFIIIFIDMELAVPALMFVPIFNASLRMISEYKNIFWPAFWKITILGLLGGFLGLFLVQYLSEIVLKVFLSIFMIFVSLKGFYELHVKTEAILLASKPSILRRLFHFVLLLLSGIYNGAFTCGGPFVAIYATDTLKEKKYFRATMYSTVLITMGIMIAKKISAGDYTKKTLITVMLLLPALLLGYFFSSKLQKRINGELFLKFVYLVLLLAGCSMFIMSSVKLILI